MTRELTTQEYMDFCRSTWAPPKHPTIVSELGQIREALPDVIAYEYDLLHACMGLVGEWLEFENAHNIANHNEELGDILYYFFRLFDLLKFPAEEIPIAVMSTHAPILMETICEIVDNCKRYIFYRQDKFHEFRESVLQGYTIFLSFLGWRNVTLKSLISANYEKLCKRYPHQRFTTEHSEVRLDKTT